jgi:N-acetylglutamate synthase-like GNAT family acetyltransferase
MLEIIPFQDKYLDDVSKVIVPIQQDEFGIPISIIDQPDLLNISTYYQKGCGNFWIALFDGSVVGTIGLLDIGHYQGALRKMFVLSAYRGPAFNVAAQLLDALVRWCRSKQIHDVFLGTTSKFLAAHRFYEKNGFLEILKTQLPPTFPVMEVDSKFYRLSLNVMSEKAKPS